ncbi:MAG: OmpA family protein [Syntrophaceae bacterium]|nr:OmpA family protein [Syntrophaceae bacterium]
MKKFGFFIFFLLLITSFPTAYAEIKEGSFSFNPFWGISIFERNQSIHKNSNFGTYGFRAGYNFTEHWALQGCFSYTQIEIDTPQWYNTPWQDIYSYNIEGLYHFMPNGRFVPFIAAGLGFNHYSRGQHPSNDPETYEKYEADRFTVDYGAGLKYFLTENIALQADVRHFLSFNNRQDNPHHIHNDLLTTLGINFTIGAVKKAEAPIVEAKIEEAPAPVSAPVDKIADSDRDGVPDYLDKCPNSPAGLVVDKRGCLPDSDNDGVLDYEDRCPETPHGMKVDKNGCPSDSDNDGVDDYNDKCPRTPKGILVGKDGCAREKVSMLLKIEFDSGRAVVKKQYHKEMKKVADFMRENPKATATIIGHTDNTGKRQDNIRLSRKRANSIRTYLIKKFHIKASRIKAIGYGPDRPIASNKTKNGRQKNRRVFAIFETVPAK